MSRFVRFTLVGGKPILVNAEHITHALTRKPGGSVLMLTGVEGGGEGGVIDVHPPFATVRESLDEVERLLSGAPEQTSEEPRWRWPFGGGR